MSIALVRAAWWARAVAQTGPWNDNELRLPVTKEPNEGRNIRQVSRDASVYRLEAGGHTTHRRRPSSIRLLFLIFVLVVVFHVLVIFLYLFPLSSFSFCFSTSSSFSSYTPPAPASSYSTASVLTSIDYRQLLLSCWASQLLNGGNEPQFAVRLTLSAVT